MINYFVGWVPQLNPACDLKCGSPSILQLMETMKKLR